MKNKKRTILCALLATVFLMPLMGNTALADTVTYYFNSYDPNEAWENPSGNGASTTIGGDVHLLNGNTCPGTNLGTITMVELRVHGYYEGVQRDIILRPVFGGSSDGDNYPFITTTRPSWSP